MTSTFVGYIWPDGSIRPEYPPVHRERCSKRHERTNRRCKAKVWHRNAFGLCRYHLSLTPEGQEMLRLNDERTAARVAYNNARLRPVRHFPY